MSFKLFQRLTQCLLGPSRQRLSGREHLSFFYKDRQELPVP